MKKAFISFFYEDDKKYKDNLVAFNDISKVFKDESVDSGEISEDLSDDDIARIIREKYLRQTEVTILLLGKNTHTRKHVDWEISSSLRKTPVSPRSSLLIIVLPEHPAYMPIPFSSESTLRNRITQENTSQRIAANVRNGYATVISWSNIFNPGVLSKAINDSTERMVKTNPDNSALMRSRNSNSNQYNDFYKVEW